MNEHKSIKGDQTEQLVKFSQHHIFLIIQEWTLGDTTIKVLASLGSFHFFIICKNYFPYLVLPSTFKILMGNLDRKHFER